MSNAGPRNGRKDVAGDPPPLATNIRDELGAVRDRIRRHVEEISWTREAIEVERRRYRELLDGVPGGCAVTDRFGKIVEANAALAELLNTDPAALRGRRLVNYVVGGDGRRDFQLALVRVRQTARIDDLPLVLRPRRALPVRSVVVSAVAKRDAGGEIVAARWLIRPA